MYIGLTIIAVSKSISFTGIYASIVGFAYVLFVNVYCVFILLKVRNRFKSHKIVDIADLAAVLYGEKVKNWISTALIVTNGMFLCAYLLYISN